MSKAIWTVPELYQRRPSLEYSQAFDLCVKNIHNQDRAILAVLSSPVHAVELLKRCQSPLHLAGTGRFDAANFVTAAQEWAWGPLGEADLAGTGRAYSSILWAEPEEDSAEKVAYQLRHQAASRADLWVITTGPLRRFLPAWQDQPAPAIHPLDSRVMKQMLRKAGWQIREQVAFHGPRSIAWSYLGRAAEKLKRPDWGDQCNLAMRKSYREPGWLWPLAPLALIHARTI